MKLICPNCGEFVPGPDIDLRRSLGVCRPCGEVVPLPAVVVRAPDGTLRFEGSAAFTAREITSLPLYAYRPEGNQLSEQRQGQRLVLTLPEDRTGAVISLLLGAIWASLLPLWPDTLRNPDARTLILLWIVFAGIHVSSAAVLLFLAVRSYVNKTRLVLSPARFAVEFGPLWRSGSLAMPLRDIRCFVDSSIYVTRLPDRWFRPPLAYDVTLLTRDNRSIPLDLIVDQREHARYLALRLNRALDELRVDEPRPPAEVVDEPSESDGDEASEDGGEEAADSSAASTAAAV